MEIDLIDQSGEYRATLKMKVGDKCFELNHLTGQTKQIRPKAGRVKMRLNCGYTLAKNKNQAIKKIGKTINP